MPVASNPADQKFLDDVEKFGWVVRIIYPDDPDTEPMFHYSCGIFRRVGHAELIVFGLSPEVGHFLVNEYAARLAAGETFEPGERYEGFVGNWPVIFVDQLDQKAALHHLTWTDWYYDRKPFPVLQCVLPDPSNGKFPWEEGYRDQMHESQPLLFPISRFKSQ
ncbi:MAG: hypothetical protein CFE31_09150 [Rhizobiales bacterium PAR1]|nr:MAG: hypothetical protein CFE31_09150 [Rhizobiales bacterium PAR1]